MTDNDLLAAFGSGSEDAFAEIIRRYTDVVYSACLRILGDSQAAEDATQAAFLVLVHKGGSLPSGVTLAAWLHSTARYSALQLRRAEQRRASREQEVAEMKEEAADSKVWEGLAPVLDEALEGLPSSQRNAVVLRHLRGLSHSQIAAELGCAEPTVQTWLTRGLETLRRRLNRKGLTVPTVTLGTLIGARAVEAAPPHVAATIQAICTGKAAAPSAVNSTAEGAMKMMFWSQMKSAAAVLVMATAASVAGVGVYRALGEETPPRPPAAEAKPDPVKPLPAKPPADGTIVGWRGNQTGLFPDAKVPAEWSSISTGPSEGLACAAEAPTDAAAAPKDTVPVVGGLIKKWLAIGPIAVADGRKDFATEQIPGEPNLAPHAGDKVGELAWTAVDAATDGVSFWSVRGASNPGNKPNLVSYACTAVHAKKAGTMRAIIEHVVGVKIWVNGKQVYSEPQQRIAMGSAYGLSRNRLASVWPIAPAFEIEVKQGWNRIVVKLVSMFPPGWCDHLFLLRVEDPPTTKYERKNIVWDTPLPDHSNATPIIVGDRIFVMSEPDELICIDKKTGKILWNAMNSFYDATPQAEREANPVFKEKLDPLAKALKDEPDPVKRWTLRKQLQDGLLAVDKKKYAAKPSDHLAGHFEIVGFTNTPVSDGKHVYVWIGTGVAACYDLDGNRKWIQREPPGPELHYSAAPAVIDGKLAVIIDQLLGLDCATGEVAWKQTEVNKTVASLLSARIAGTAVFVSQQGEIVRASDGKMLWKNSRKIVNDTGWAAPVVIGDVLYLPWYGIAQVHVIDFAGCTGDEWKPKETTMDGVTQGAPRAKGDQGDPWTAGSPLIYNGMLYDTDIHSRLFAMDLKTRKQVYWKDLGLPGESNYVALRMAASPTLIGKFIVIMDNQGNSVTIEPGAECKIISRNRIGTQIQRDWAMTTQELISYAPPVADGERMYLRGERFLYCIGEK